MPTLQDSINKAREEIEVAQAVAETKKSELFNANLGTADFAQHIARMTPSTHSEEELRLAKAKMREYRIAASNAQNAHENALNDVKFAQERLQLLLDEVDPAEALAVAYHDAHCHLSHMDQCSWQYEKDFTGSEHKRWKDKAERLIEAVNGNVEVARRVLAVI